MKRLIAEHACNAFLKPGEVIISRKPILVSTILGSCVAITMYSPVKKVGGICHAMFPTNPGQEENFHYVDTAVRRLYRKMVDYGGRIDMVVKIFGGAKVLHCSDCENGRKTVGEQNIHQAKMTLEELKLPISREDIGGTEGRKLFFSVKSGDVFLRRLKMRRGTCGGETTA